MILPASLRAQVNLTVNANQTIRTVDERVFGVNAVMWDPQAGSAQTITMVQNAGIRTIRVPGGSLSDEYHWRVNKALANTWTWATGFNGFINLITSAGVQPMVTVNYGSGTPEEAAGLVAYLNASLGSNIAIGGTDGTGFAMQDSGYWAALRAAGPVATDDGMNFLRISRASPVGAKYFEIGNECYGTWETDQQAIAHDPTTYANRVQQYIAKMKAVDPTIKIGVVVVTGSESPGYKNWTPVMLARLKVLNAIPDFIIYHLYPQAPGSESDATLLQVADTGSNSWTTIAADLRNQLNTYLTDRAAGVEIVVTENNSVYSSPGKQSTSLVNGLYLGDSVGNLMRTEINGYMYWALRNSTPTLNNGTVLDGNMSSSLYGWRQFGDYGMISTPSTLTGETTYYNPYPTYYIMKLLSKFARGGDSVVQATSNNSRLSIFATKRSNGALALLVINKDPANALSANVTLTGFSPGSTATTYFYGKPQDLAGSSADLVTSSLAVTGSSFATSFPSYSATVLSFDATVAPTITTQPVGQTVLVGSPFTLTVGATGSPVPTFQWYKGGVAIGGATLASYTVANAALGDGGNYSVVATNSGGAATSNSVVVVVRDPPIFTTQPLSQAIFSGGTITFSSATTSTSAVTYQWQKNGINVPGASNASLTLNNIQVSDAGSYALVATNANSSATSRFARLVVLVPQANAVVYTPTAYPTGVTAGGNVGLDYVLTDIGTHNWGANHYLSIRDSNGNFVAFASLIGVNSGENKTVHLSFPAPTTPGTYTYTVQGLEGGVEFFSTQTTFTLNVLAAQANSVTYNATNFPITATPGSNLIFNYNVTNTGTKNWGVHHFLTLRDEVSVFSLFSSLNGVAPGASKTVNLSLTAPTNPGIYPYYVQALEDGVEFFQSQANLTLTVLAPQPNAIVYTPTRSQDNVTPGATVSLRYSLSNAGTGTWGASHYASLRDGNGAFLAFISISGVAPLGTKTVDFSLVAPTTPGIYTYYVQAFEDGVEFFDSQDLVTLTVLATPIGNAATYNATTFPITAARGASVTFTSNVTNRGTKTWGANHYLSLRDADNVFLSFQPIAGLAPGASKTLTFNFTAPTSPGVYTYHVQGFESGVEFFNMSDNLVLIVP